MSERAPLLSVVTVSLNSARFLRETLDSVARQSFKDYEHVVVDGGSTDGTQAILAEYPSIRWISEPDGDLGIAAAFHKGAAMARGKYVIQCCISDGFLDREWFAKAVRYLETHADCALIWSLPQQMSDDGSLLGLFHGELLDHPPKNGTAFLAFWLASKFVFPEGNYCTHTTIFRECFPGPRSPRHYLIQPHLGFVFNFMRRGYLAAMIPQVSSYFRAHQGQRYQQLAAVERPAAVRHGKDVVHLWWAIVLGTTRYEYRYPDGSPKSTIGLGQRAQLLMNVLIQRTLRMKILRYPPIRGIRYVTSALRRKTAA